MNIYVLIPYQEGEEATVLKNLRILSKEKRAKIYVVGPKKLKGKAKFIVERKRKGKSYWIKKLLLKHEKGILVLISGDVQIKENFLSEALKQLKGKVGMVCCRIVPKKPTTFIEKIGYSIWMVHGEASRLQPKGGEAIIFRAGIVKKFHKRIVTDEAYIEANVAKAGWKIVYDKNLVIRNKLPRRLSEYFSQRVRYHIGHLQTKKETGYKVVSLRYFLLFKAMIMMLRETPKFFPYLLFAIVIEIIARLYGRILFSLGRLPYKWKLLLTTRVLSA